MIHQAIDGMLREWYIVRFGEPLQKYLRGWHPAGSCRDVLSAGKACVDDFSPGWGRSSGIRLYGLGMRPGAVASTGTPWGGSQASGLEPARFHHSLHCPEVDWLWVK
jgi:hypothetical protein